MYIPKHFAIEDESLALDFVEKYSFGTLVTNVDGMMNANHVPFLLDREKRRLRGHFAKPNIQWRELEKNKAVLVIFQEPHAYISPSWYKSENQVPTWNFNAIHVYGEAEIMQSADETYGVVEGLSQKHESRFERPWHPASMNQDILRSMLGAIVGFKINITEIQAKAKLSQNRSKNDQASAIDGLRESGSEQELEIATLMRVNLNK